jgi:hypothetical protein
MARKLKQEEKRKRKLDKKKITEDGSASNETGAEDSSPLPATGAEGEILEQE